MSDGGKGSAPRPFSVSQQEYDNRWDNIFGRDKPKSDNRLMEMPGTLGGAKVVQPEEHITATFDNSAVLNK